MVQTKYQISKCHDFFCPLWLLLHRNRNACGDPELISSVKRDTVCQFHLLNTKAGRTCLLNSDVFKWAFTGKIFHIQILKTIPGGFYESCLSMCDFSIKTCCLHTSISIDFRSTHKYIEQKFNPGYLVSYNVINSICGKVQNDTSFKRQCSCVTAALCGLSSCLYLGVGWLPQAQKILDDLTP